MKLGRFYIEFRSPVKVTCEKPYMRKVRKALQEERKLLAIKLYKDGSGCDLRTAKDFIDRLWDAEYKLKRSEDLTNIFVQVGVQAYNNR